MKDIKAEKNRSKWSQVTTVRQVIDTELVAE